MHQYRTRDGARKMNCYESKDWLYASVCSRRLSKLAAHAALAQRGKHIWRNILFQFTRSLHDRTPSFNEHKINTPAHLDVTYNLPNISRLKQIYHTHVRSTTLYMTAMVKRAVPNRSLSPGSANFHHHQRGGGRSGGRVGQARVGGGVVGGGGAVVVYTCRSPIIIR